jgi:hypothetical protein
MDANWNVAAGRDVVEVRRMRVYRSVRSRALVDWRCSRAERANVGAEEVLVLVVGADVCDKAQGR